MGTRINDGWVNGHVKGMRYLILPQANSKIPSFQGIKSMSDNIGKFGFMCEIYLTQTMDCTRNIMVCSVEMMSLIRNLLFREVWVMVVATLAICIMLFL